MCFCLPHEQNHIFAHLSHHTLSHILPSQLNDERFSFLCLPSPPVTQCHRRVSLFCATPVPIEVTGSLIHFKMYITKALLTFDPADQGLFPVSHDLKHSWVFNLLLGSFLKCFLANSYSVHFLNGFFFSWGLDLGHLFSSLECIS